MSAPFVPLSEMIEDLELDLQGVRNELRAGRKNVALLRRETMLASWIEQLEALSGRGQPIGKLATAVSLLESVAPALGPVREPGLRNIAITYLRSMIEALHAEAKLDSALAKANQNPAQSADLSPPVPPPGSATGSSRGGGR